MNTDRLFSINHDDGSIILIYSADNSTMPAKDFGQAMLGFETCLREIAKFSGLYQEGIYVEPVEFGSLKTKFHYIRKNPWVIVVGLDIIVNLLNNSVQLIDKFGASNFKNPQKEILEQISDKKVLDLCRSYEYRSGLQKIAQPLNETNQKVQIVIGNEKTEINCENKYQYYVDKENEPILPELINGDEVTINGEITRINKKVNDLGFIYNGYTIGVSPLDKERSTSNFHEYLEMDRVELTGIVIRNSDFQVPKIKVIAIKQEEDDQLNLKLEADSE